MKSFLIGLVLYIFPMEILGQNKVPPIQQWMVHEITLTAEKTYGNPYTEIDVWALFTNEKGDSLKRPAFWDGGNTWKIRFVPIDTDGQWQWVTYSSNEKDTGLHKKTGHFNSIPNVGSNRLLKNGLLKMSAKARNVVHHSGKSFLMVADTPWALPFRATKEQVAIYAKDRQEKGFNTALMMTVQPDMKAEGPNDRNTEQGFKRAFKDLSSGHLNQMNVDYFQYYDALVLLLLDHEIVPVFQPIFHGYGWKGLEALGRTIEPKEYVRYCKYLLARYGAQPAFWLLGGDHNGKDPGILESGMMLQEWDAYAQPTGIHYNPCDDYLASWANGEREHCFHENKTYQDEEWLDFQWAQTGHDSEHLYHKVARMYENLPTKAVANGEPTYEGMNNGKNGLGWWQGEEAWMQLMNGGTMGVVYGAATLWQWKISTTEEGWPSWTDQQTSWYEAMHMKGSKYVGLIGKILGGLNIADIEKHWDLANGKPLLAIKGKLYISFLNEGGEITIRNLPDNLNYCWIDPKTGIPQQIGKVTVDTFKAPNKNPWVLLLN
ncbi:DUF4038 domain-containing protein [Maribacter halichondriae]|uniref:apiosidase-like domain-containing protein n=1 Tax=Maribacter halichondriae TaxID=2980554 RepID=UPI0023595001|nr:DUF4038 domain-containing protein [Maribacter sp. Hal144]